MHRDALMVQFDAVYPAYELAQNKGYPTPAHKRALATHGPSPLHRRSYAPVAETLSLGFLDGETID